jgi:hypothetical protein
MIMNNTSSVSSSPHFHTHGRILKITFFMSSARSDNNNNNVVVVDDDHGAKQQNMKSFSCHVCNKPFSSNKSLNGHMRSHNQNGFKKQNNEMNHQDQLPPAIDLSNYLPPITYKTNKRRNRFFIDDDARNAAQTLLDMSRGKFLNFDHVSRDCKRIKLFN